MKEKDKKQYQQPDVIVQALIQDDVVRTSANDYLATPNGWNDGLWGRNNFYGGDLKE